MFEFITFEYVVTLLIALLPILLYALGEIKKALESGEQFNIAQFLKTIVLQLVTAGLITQTIGDQINMVIPLLVMITSSSVFTYYIDKFLNAIAFKKK